MAGPQKILKSRTWTKLGLHNSPQTHAGFNGIPPPPQTHKKNLDISLLVLLHNLIFEKQKSFTKTTTTKTNQRQSRDK